MTKEEFLAIIRDEEVRAELVSLLSQGLKAELGNSTPFEITVNGEIIDNTKDIWKE